MNPIVQKLSDGKEVYGVLSPSSDPIIVEMMGVAGYDYFMIEGEHRNPTNIEEVCRAAESVGIAPLARVRSNNPKLILQYLDAGVNGIMLPGVKKADEVKSFIKALKYPPDGVRGLGPSRANRYLIGEESLSSIINQANEDIISIVQIETKEAFENLTEILDVNGIDIVVIGTADLSLALGHNSFDGYMRDVTIEIIDKCRSKRLPVGLVATSVQDVVEWRKKGVNFFINTLGGLLKSGVSARD